MSKTVLHEGDEGVTLIIRDPKKKVSKKPKVVRNLRSPIHVVYGGANLFKSDTARKLGDIALRSLEKYAPSVVDFVDAFELPDSKSWIRNRTNLKQFERGSTEDPHDTASGDLSDPMQRFKEPVPGEDRSCAGSHAHLVSFKARVAREVDADSCEQNRVPQSVAGIPIVEKNRCIRISARGAWSGAVRRQSSGLAGTISGTIEGAVGGRVSRDLVYT